MIVALLVSYKGDCFSGFAKQPGQLTVQGSLEEALAMIFRKEIETTCAGRTDSGVHARGQVVSFELDEADWGDRNEYKVLRSLNALSHEDIAVRAVKKAPAGFSARFSATMRQYRYFIAVDKYPPLFMRDFSWHIPKTLNLRAMRKASNYLVGEHDFKSFCLASSAEGKSTNRYVERIDISEETVYGEHLVVITVEGNAFLHSMVRTMVGTLVAVGLEKRSPEWVLAVLSAKDRKVAGENAPAKGLVFWEVSYEGERVHDPFYKMAHAVTQDQADMPLIANEDLFGASGVSASSDEDLFGASGVSAFLEEEPARAPRSSAFSDEGPARAPRVTKESRASFSPIKKVERSPLDTSKEPLHASLDADKESSGASHSSDKKASSASFAFDEEPSRAPFAFDEELSSVSFGMHEGSSNVLFNANEERPSVSSGTKEKQPSNPFGSNGKPSSVPFGASKESPSAPRVSNEEPSNAPRVPNEEKQNKERPGVPDIRQVLHAQSSNEAQGQKEQPTSPTLDEIIQSINAELKNKEKKDKEQPTAPMTLTELRGITSTSDADYEALLSGKLNVTAENAPGASEADASQTQQENDQDATETKKAPHEGKKKKTFKFHSPKELIAERKERARMPEFVIPRGEAVLSPSEKDAFSQNVSSGTYGDMETEDLNSALDDEDKLFQRRQHTPGEKETNAPKENKPLFARKSKKAKEPLKPEDSGNLTYEAILSEARYPFQRKKSPVENSNSTTPEK